MKTQHLRKDSGGDVWAGLPWCDENWDRFPDVLDYDKVGLVDCEKCLEAYMRMYDLVRQRLNDLRKSEE